MGRSKRVGIVFFVAMFALAITSIGSTQTLGGVTGEASDTTGAVLPGVTVEASSPSLIGPSRVAVTDGSGRYSIVQLTPGTYTVTFTLPGFSTFIREDVALTTGFTATINAQLEVGGLEETVTVSGESPQVDIQNSRAQTVLSREILDAVPRGKGYAGLQSMTVGALGGLTTPTAGRDVGGTRGDGYSGALNVHGNADGKLTLDGKPTSFRGTRMTLFHINNMAVEEVVVDIGGNTAETQYGGSSVRVISKDGGNIFAGSFIGEVAPPGMQSNNLTSKIQQRGISDTLKIKRIYDVGGSFGGPIQQDKLWFFHSSRIWEAQEFMAGVFYNKLQGQMPPFHENDLSRPAFTKAYDRDSQTKITWQAGEKHKLTFQHVLQKNCGCFFGQGSFFAPEATFPHYFEGPLGGQHMLNTTWTYPASNSLLIEAKFGYWRVHNNIPAIDGVGKNDIAVFDMGLGKMYGQLFTTNPFTTNPGWVNTQGDKGDQGDTSQEFKISYVTGSHAFKFGMQSVQQRYNEESTGTMYSPAIQYWLLNRVPIGINQLAAPNYYNLRMLDLGLFAQDAWTVNRLTLNIGVRYDHTRSFSPAFSRPGGFFLDKIDFPAMSGFSNFNDVMPRIGLSYDIFGTGGTAFKFNMGKNAVNEGMARILGTHPAIAMTSQANRTWSDANGDYLPDCDLQNNAANGECGALSASGFGTATTIVAYNDDAKSGWGNRQYQWVMSALLQHQLVPGIAVSFGYYRTTYGNFTTRENIFIGPADHTEYCVTNPNDSRLPNSGATICGAYDINPDKYGQASFVNALSDNSQIYNGVDLLIDAQFDNGATLQGGFNTGETIIDNCSHPDVPPQWCRQASPPWSGQHNVKLAGQYPLPVAGIVISGTYLNLPGISRRAQATFTNAQIAPSLGRDLSACGSATGAACTATKTLDLYPNNTQFEPRQQQIDLRIAANMDMGQFRVQPRFEIFNLLNANDVQQINGRFGSSWGNASVILTARLFKFGVSIDY